MPGNQLVEQRTEGVQVVRRLRRLATQLLRARVVRRAARRHAGAGPRRQAEIREPRAPGTIQQYVAALEVAVHEARVMKCGQRCGDVVGRLRPVLV
jgi:hypothetical protein